MHREPSDHVPGARRLPQREHHGDDAAARDMRDELEAHLALRRDALVAAGMDADAALLEARRRFGDFEATQAQLVALAQDRDRRTTHRDRLATLVGDWTLALRRVRRAPASFALPVVTIAIAVALCCTVFALVDGVLLKPLAFPRSEELLAIQGADSLGAPIVTVSSDNWHDWREQSRTLSAVAIYQPLRVSVVANGDASTRAAVVAPADVFDVMQPQFLWGRRYTTDDADSDAGAVVVSERLWHDLFGDRTPSAATVTIGGTPRTIVGVVRQAHVYPEWTEVWLPYRHRQIGGAARNNINWLALGRMRAGVSVESAQRDLSAVAARIRAAETVPLNSPGVRVLPLIDIVVGDFSSFLRLLLVSVGAVLLLACTNLAAANLSRAAGRARDFAVQLAIGASRARLAGQLLVEHATVALMGAALGTIGAAVVIRFIASADLALPRLSDVHFDGRIALVAVGLTIFTALLTAAAPIAFIRHTAPGRALSAGGRGASRSGRGLPGRWFVGTQVVLAVLLVAWAGLSVVSMRALLAQPLGFDPHGLSTAEVLLSTPRYRQAAPRMAYWNALSEALRADPTIRSASLALFPPLSSGATSAVEFADRTVPDASAGYRAVSEGYFETLRTPLLVGRTLTARDDTTQARVAVINRLFADRYFGSDNPIGRSVRAPSIEAYYFGGTAPWLTVVGVVGNVRSYGYGTDLQPELYTSYRQLPAMTFGLTAVVRRVDGRDADSRVRDLAARLEPLVAPNVVHLDDVLSRQVGGRAFTMRLLALFGILALLIAALGVYATLSIAVQRRARELAIRQALGSRPSQVMRLVLESAIRVLVVGSVIGVAAIVLLGDVIRATLFELAPLNSRVLLLSVAGVVVSGTLAAMIPAWRSTRIGPLRAMTAE